jgi:hypothetical protein
MSDIFLKKDALNLLKKKHIVFFGDSSKLKLFLIVLSIIIKTSVFVCMHAFIYVCKSACICREVAMCGGRGGGEC